MSDDPIEDETIDAIMRRRKILAGLPVPTAAGFREALVEAYQAGFQRAVDEASHSRRSDRTTR